MTHPLQLSPDYVKIEIQVVEAKVVAKKKRKRRKRLVKPKVILSDKAIIQILKRVKDKGISLCNLETREVYQELYINQRLTRYQMVNVLNSNETKVTTQIRKFKIRKQIVHTRRPKGYKCKI